MAAFHREFPQNFPALGRWRQFVAAGVFALGEISGVKEVVITTGGNLFGRAKSEIAELGSRTKARYLLEPCRRNTAPAVAAACQYLERLYDGEAIIFASPTDQLVTATKRFLAAADRAVERAAAGHLVVLGITPTHPDESYGYIEVADEKVVGFTEKPDSERAAEMVEKGNYLWNCGIYCSKVETLLGEFAAHAPRIAEIASRAVPMKPLSESLALNEEDFAEMPDISLDYAIAQESKKLVVVATEGKGWEDVGSWKSLGGLKNKDGDGNRMDHGTMAVDCHDCIIHGENVAALGVKDLIIAADNQRVLVAAKPRAGEIRQFAEMDKMAPRREYRPWGYFETVDRGEGFRVKRIGVSPGGMLSLQAHQHRSEHWVVVNGIATVTKGEEVFSLKSGERTFIPRRCKHRLANRHEQLLLLVEVQMGDYLGEDDITRHEDAYGRK